MHQIAAYLRVSTGDQTAENQKLKIESNSGARVRDSRLDPS